MQNNLGAHPNGDLVTYQAHTYGKAIDTYAVF